VDSFAVDSFNQLSEEEIKRHVQGTLRTFKEQESLFLDPVQAAPSIRPCAPKILCPSRYTNDASQILPSSVCFQSKEDYKRYVKSILCRLKEQGSALFLDCTANSAARREIDADALANHVHANPIVKASAADVRSISDTPLASEHKRCIVAKAKLVQKVLCRNWRCHR
jgi:hypothetical protein